MSISSRLLRIAASELDLNIDGLFHGDLKLRAVCVFNLLVYTMFNFKIFIEPLIFTHDITCGQKQGLGVTIFKE